MNGIATVKQPQELTILDRAALQLEQSNGDVTSNAQRIGAVLDRLGIDAEPEPEQEGGVPSQSTALGRLDDAIQRTQHLAYQLGRLASRMERLA